jgi:hypothetical protein
MLANRVRETANAPGTGTTMSLIGPTAGYVGFVGTFGSGVSVYYAITDGSQTEIQVGTVTAGTPNILSRGTPLWTSVHGVTSPSRLNFTGSVVVYNVLPAQKTLFLDGSGNLSMTGSAILGGGLTLGGDLLIAKATPVITLRKTAAGQTTAISGFLNSTLRWQVLLGDTSAETGGNAGSDLVINRFNDAGAYLDTPLVMKRSNGYVGIRRSPTVELDVAGTIRADTSVEARVSGRGFARMTAGGVNEPGILEFMTADSVRRGYIGWQVQPNKWGVYVENGWGFDLPADVSVNGGAGAIWAYNTVKAWVNFNGQGTPAMRGSFNVSSITDHGTGNWTANYVAAMPNANYSVVGSNNALSGYVTTVEEIGIWGVRVTIRLYGAGGPATDPSIVCLQVAGG